MTADIPEFILPPALRRASANAAQEISTAWTTRRSVSRADMQEIIENAIRSEMVEDIMRRMKDD